MNQLNPRAFALACGSTWALGLIVLALIALFTGGSYGDTVISFLSTVYKGYRPTIPGALVGGVWGFIDGAICGYVLAYLYNYFMEPRIPA